PNKQGLYQFSSDEAGEYSAVATATDAAGNTSTAEVSISVVDTSDIDAPQIELPAEQLADYITAPTELLGTVDDQLVAGFVRV
ncbi:MAG: hypothetical protein AAGM36_20025, partial [Cyanobacteria bacterium J06597_1]